jgi:hypothetical protein
MLNLYKALLKDLLINNLLEIIKMENMDTLHDF